ncbi:MAG: glycosyltransferase family 4 protein [Aggregatilineales bacterium]
MTKILYSLPHPSDRLGTQQAGHVIRATAMLAALETLGNEVIHLQAATEQSTQAAVGLYRGVVKKLLPRAAAMRLRDTARVAHGRRYAQRLIETIGKHRPDVILETHIAFSLAGKIASEETGVPLVLDDVAPAWEEEKEYGVGLKQMARDVHRQVTERARLLVAVSASIRHYLIAEGLAESKIITVENGIDARLFGVNADQRQRRKQLNIPDDALVIVFVGSFQRYHQVDLLLEAFARLQTAQPTHLLLVGDGQCSAECKMIAQRLGLTNRTTFTGSVPYQDVASYIVAGDIAIMPATNDYGNPMKVYEYLAMGKALIAPDQPTITEIVTNGKNAYLFAREDVGAMTTALKTLIEEPMLRQELGTQAGWLAAECTWEKRAAILSDALQTIKG